MEKDDEILLNHLRDLCKKAGRAGICTYSDFLSLNEQSLFLTHLQEFKDAPYVMFGGKDFAERQMIGFMGNEYADASDFPIACLKIQSLSGKFTEKLTHRDFLGSLIGLGLERATLGDIFVFEDHAFLYCTKAMESFIVDNLLSVRHTNVSVESLDFEAVDFTPRIEEIKDSVASLRLDAIITSAFPMGRSKGVELIESKKVFVNGRLTEKASKELKVNDTVSVRGFGKFILTDASGLTKKNRIIITISKYL